MLGVGFLLGLRHATDADHITAITSITSKEESITKASLIGILWGIGHSASVTLVAIPVILFTVNIPPKIALGFEFLVGIMLVALGLFTLTGLSQKFRPKIHTIRPLFIGIIHGLAGSTTIALLILSTIKNSMLSMLYLFVFHLGVICGMLVITTLLGTTITMVKNRSIMLHKYLVMTSGIVSFVFGLYIIYKTALI